MRILLTHDYKGETITATPLVKRDRFPPIREVIIDNGEAFAILYDDNSTHLYLGCIPKGFEMVCCNKYEIVFKTNTPVKKKSKILIAVKKDKVNNQGVIIFEQIK